MQFETLHFGVIQYEPDAVIHFPLGLPGFEEERQFIALEQPHTRPIVFLQSLSRPELCFITLPVQTILSDYRLSVATEDLRLLELPADRQPEIGSEVLCLAIVAVGEDQPPTANLLAPIVINLRNRRAVQAIQCEMNYSHRHLLLAAGEEATACSSCGGGSARQS